MGRPAASTAVIDGTIAGDGHRPRARPSQLLEGRQRAPPPRLVGVMLQQVGGRHPQLVRNPYPRRHLAVLVDGYRFDRGGADVDADCDVFA